MSTKVNQLILYDGGKANIHCKDGVSAITAFKTRTILNLGGEINFENCDAKNKWITFYEAYTDMKDLWDK